jgi:integrase
LQSSEGIRYCLASDCRNNGGNVAIEKLGTPAKIKKLGPGKHHDGGGLYLFNGDIDEATARPRSSSWVYRASIDKKQIHLGLGSFDPSPAAVARVRAKARSLKAEVHRHAEEGGPVNPVARRREAEREQQREREQAQDAKKTTFKAYAGSYLLANGDSWKSSKHLQQWTNTLQQYCYPIIGGRQMEDIRVAHVVDVLRQPVRTKDGKPGTLWKDKCETGRRVRSRIDIILQYATALRKDSAKPLTENPAKWELLKPLLGDQTDETKHHAAMHYDQIGDFMVRLRAHKGVGALPLEFCILTNTRTDETVGAVWPEIDLDKRLWTVPGRRRKGPKGKTPDLEVPLSDRCMAILQELAQIGTSGLVFPNNGSGRRLGTNALLVTLKDQLQCPVTAHGFRSCFRDWAGDCTGFSREVVEAAMGHALADKVEAAYRRGSALQKRRQLMAAWARHCATPSGGERSDNVIAIGSA